MTHKEIKTRILEIENNFGFTRKRIVTFMKVNKIYFDNRIKSENDAIFHEIDLENLEEGIKKHCRSVLYELNKKPQ